MGGWGTIGDPVNNYISVVLLTLSDQIHKKQFDQQTCVHRGRWGTVDTFLNFRPLLLYFKSKQAQNLSHNKATLFTQYHAKTLKQRP